MLESIFSFLAGKHKKRAVLKNIEAAHIGDKFYQRLERRRAKAERKCTAGK